MAAFLARLLLCAALATTAAGAVAPRPAEAHILPFDPLGTVQQTLTGLLGGVTQGVQGLLCPAVGGTVLEPVACNLDLLHLQFATRFKRHDGTIHARTYGAILTVPTLLDVDGDGISDVIATASLRSLDSVSVSIVKLPTAPARFPAAVEAIVADPTKGSLPRALIAYGEDGLDSTLPASFESTVSFGSEGEATRIQVDDQVRGAGESLKVVAELFDGTPQARMQRIGGSLRYTPVPSRFGAGLRIGAGFEGTLTAAAPATLDVAFERNDGAAIERFAGTIDRLPASTRAAFQPGGEDQRAVAFEASAPIDRIEGAYEAGSRAPSGDVTIRDRAEASILAMPRRVRVEQAGAREASVSTEGTGPIGQVRVGLANGTPRFLDGDDAYIHAFSDGTLRSFAAQVNGLTGATFDGRDAIRLDATFATPDANPLRVALEDPEREVDIRVDDLPGHITAAIDLAAGAIDYDGHGRPVGAIDLDARQATPFFTRATRIKGAIRDLPPQVELRFKPDARRAAFSASAPIGLVDVLATSGPLDALPGDAAGVRYVDRPDAYVVNGRIRGLRAASLEGTAPYRAAVEMAAGDFTLHYDDGDHLLDGRIGELPGTLAASIDPAAGRHEYSAAATIDEIEVTYRRRSAPLAPRVHLAGVRLTGVPKDVVVTGEPDAAGGMKVVADPPLGSVEAAISSDATAPLPAVPGTDSGALAVATPAELKAAVRVQRLREVAIAANPLTVTVEAERPQRFTLSGRYNDAADVFPNDTTVDGFIEEIPARVSLTVEAGKTRYEASEEIGRIFLQAHKLPATIQEAKVDIRGVPRTLDIFTGEDGSGERSFGVAAPAGGSIGQIDINLADFQRYPDLPQTKNAVALDTYEVVPDPDGVVNFRTHLRDLSRAVVTAPPESSTTVLDLGVDGRRPLDIDLRAGETFVPVEADVTISELPLSTRVAVTAGQSTDVRFESSHPIPLVTADVRIGPDGFSLGTPHEKMIFTGQLRNVPTQARVCFTTENPRCIGAFPVMTPHAISFSSAAKVQAHLETNGPPPGSPGAMTLDARVCLGPLSGVTHYSPAGCRANEHAWKYVDIRGLQLTDFHLELADGGAIDSYYNDEGNIALFLDTEGLGDGAAGNGVLFDRIRYVDPELPFIDGLQLLQPDEHIRFDRWWFAVDLDTLTGIPDLREVRGSVTCPESTVLNFLERELSTGAIRLMTLGGFDFDWSDNLLGC